MARTPIALDLPSGLESGALLEARVASAGRTWTPSQRTHAGDVAWGAAAHDVTPGHRRLWCAGNDVVAWSFVEGDDQAAYADVHVDPSQPQELADEVIRWTAKQARVVVVPVLDRERHLIRGLESVGAQEDSTGPWFIHLAMPLNRSLPQPLVPAGYVVRPVEESERDERVAVHRRSWAPARVKSMLGQELDGTEGESSFSREAYDRVCATSLYRRDLDLVVQEPGGKLVATALGWWDPHSSSGLIEPVGTDPSYAVRGLGRAACAALLVALADVGAQNALVCPRGDDAYPVPRRLYVGLGMSAVGRTRSYVIGRVGGRL